MGALGKKGRAGCPGTHTEWTVRMKAGLGVITSTDQGTPTPVARNGQAAANSPAQPQRQAVLRPPQTGSVRSVSPRVEWPAPASLGYKYRDCEQHSVVWARGRSTGKEKDQKQALPWGRQQTTALPTPGQRTAGLSGPHLLASCPVCSRRGPGPGQPLSPYTTADLGFQVVGRKALMFVWG